MNWKYGKDRADVDSFWNSMLAKTGLIKRTGGGEKRAVNPDARDGESRKTPKSDLQEPT